LFHPWRISTQPWEYWNWLLMAKTKFWQKLLKYLYHWIGWFFITLLPYRSDWTCGNEKIKISIFEGVASFSLSLLGLTLTNNDPEILQLTMLQLIPTQSAIHFYGSYQKVQEPRWITFYSQMVIKPVVCSV